MINVVNVLGLNNNQAIQVVQNDGTLHNNLSMTLDGNTPGLERFSHPKVNVTNFYIGGETFSYDLKVQAPAVFFNCMCSVEQCRLNFKRFSSMLERIKVPVINHPKYVKKSNRDDVYRLLKGVKGVRFPRTVRITPLSLNYVRKAHEVEGLGFPFLFRDILSHGGTSMVKVNSAADFWQLEQFAFDGRDYFMIEYIDFKNSNQIYEKSRVLVIEGRAYPRHMMFAKEWNVHSKNNMRAMYSEFQAQEEKFVNSEVSQQLESLCFEFYQKTKLDYFGLDFCWHQGELLVFELNSCMRPYSPAKRAAYREKSTKKVHEALYQLIRSKADLS